VPARIVHDEDPAGRSQDRPMDRDRQDGERDQRHQDGPRPTTGHRRPPRSKNFGGDPQGRYDPLQEVLPMRRFFVLSATVLALTACASTPPRVQRSEFEDIPVPKGLAVDLNRSTIIESPTVKAARLFYKGRIEPESLSVAFRTTLEANGWKHLSSTTSSDKGTTQVYEKAGSTLQVLIYESWYYTWVEMSATRMVGQASAQLRQ
jgi:hypothetical protein